MGELTLYQGDCIDYLENMEGKVECIFADPPDEDGRLYKSHEHLRRRGRYYKWLDKLIRLSLDRCNVFVFSYKSRRAIKISMVQYHILIRSKVPFIQRYVIWRYTFGLYSKHGFANGHRMISIFRRHGIRLNYNAIREESQRMRYGDYRNTGFKIPDDVWEYPRVINKHADYQDWHPCQHPTALYDRLMKLCCPPGSTFLDLFAGSGTCFRAARLNPDLRVIGIEMEPEYCQKMYEKGFVREPAKILLF